MAYITLQMKDVSELKANAWTVQKKASGVWQALLADHSSEIQNVMRTYFEQHSENDVMTSFSLDRLPKVYQEYVSRQVSDHTLKAVEEMMNVLKMADQVQEYLKKLTTFIDENPSWSSWKRDRADAQKRYAAALGHLDDMKKTRRRTVSSIRSNAKLATWIEETLTLLLQNAFAALQELDRVAKMAESVARDESKPPPKPTPAKPQERPQKPAQKPPEAEKPLEHTNAYRHEHGALVHVIQPVPNVEERLAKLQKRIETQIEALDKKQSQILKAASEGKKRPPDLPGMMDMASNVQAKLNEIDHRLSLSNHERVAKEKRAEAAANANRVQQMQAQPDLSKLGALAERIWTKLDSVEERMNVMEIKSTLAAQNEGSKPGLTEAEQVKMGNYISHQIERDLQRIEAKIRFPNITDCPHPEACMNRMGFHTRCCGSQAPPAYHGNLAYCSVHCNHRPLNSRWSPLAWRGQHARRQLRPLSELGCVPNRPLPSIRPASAMNVLASGWRLPPIGSTYLDRVNVWDELDSIRSSDMYWRMKDDRHWREQFLWQAAKILTDTPELVQSMCASLYVDRSKLGSRPDEAEVYELLRVWKRRNDGRLYADELIAYLLNEPTGNQPFQDRYMQMMRLNAAERLVECVWQAIEAREHRVRARFRRYNWDMEAGDNFVLNLI